MTTRLGAMLCLALTLAACGFTRDSDSAGGTVTMEYIRAAQPESGTRSLLPHHGGG